MNLTRALFISGTWGPSRPMVTTMAATRPAFARALTRRTSSSNNGSRTCRTGVPVRLGGAFKTPRKQIMPTAPGLSGQVGGVGPGKVQRGGDLPADLDAQARQLTALVRVVAQHPDAVDTKPVHHLPRARAPPLLAPPPH